MKTVVILGATGTIGKHLVELYKHENLIVAGRKNVEIGTYLFLDLADAKSITSFIEQVSKVQLDLLFVNSGMYEKPVNKEQMELNFMVNCFAPYYIVKKVMENQRNCKIILTSSISVLHASTNLNLKHSRHIYRNTKLLEHKLFAYLEEKDKNNIYLYAHPGLVKSKLSLKLHSKFIGKVISLFGNSPQHGAACIIEASKLDSCHQAWVCPSKLFHLRGEPKKYKIKIHLELEEKEIEYIKKFEKRMEKLYGI